MLNDKSLKTIAVHKTQLYDWSAFSDCGIKAIRAH